MACVDCLHSPSPPGVSKIVTVDVKGNAPLWLKIKDLADGATYNFRIRAKTFTYGPEVEANITTGPGEGLSACFLTISAKQFQQVHITPLLLCDQEPRALPVSPSSLDMALPLPSTGPMGIPGEHLSPAMLLRPGLQVRLFALCRLEIKHGPVAQHTISAWWTLVLIWELQVFVCTNYFPFVFLSFLYCLSMKSVQMMKIE